MLKRMRRSLYLKLFLSFLATCLLFFLGLALFWNSYFSNLFYKDKKQLLVDRSADLKQVAKSLQEGSFSNRELRFSLRLISRSFNGQIWIVDDKGTILFSSLPEMEGKSLPKALSEPFAKAIRNGSDFFIGRLAEPPWNRPDNYLTYYMPLQLNGQQTAVFFHTPVDDITTVISAVRVNIWVPLLFSLIAVGLILYIVSRKLAGPLREMNLASLALAEGDFSIRVPDGKEDEIGQLAKSFNFMIGELERWEDTRQEFLANVSHELRSPLTTLRGMIVGMKDNVIPPEKRPHYLQICEQEVQRLQRLVDELLDLARIQNETDIYRFSRVDIIARTKETVDFLAPVIRAKGLKLEVWIPEVSDCEHPPVVELDPDRYAQILNNLLYNAMKYTPEGNGIYVRLGTLRNEFVLEVRDTGLGMTEEEVKRIWERFYKADLSRAGMEGGGVGLGLTIVKHLVVGMNGRISVESEPGAGTAFTVRFPLAG